MILGLFLSRHITNLCITLVVLATATTGSATQQQLDASLDAYIASVEVPTKSILDAEQVLKHEIGRLLEADESFFYEYVSQLSGQRRQLLLPVFITTYAWHDGEAAIKWVQESLAPDERASLASTLFLAYGQKSPRLALDAITKWDQPIPRTHAKLVEMLAVEDMSKAFEMAVEEVLSPPARPAHVSTDALHMGPRFSGLLAAIERTYEEDLPLKIERFPKGIHQHLLAQAYVNQCARDNSTDTFAWVLSQQSLDPQLFHAVTKSFLQQVHRDQPKLALALVDEVADAEEQKRLYYWISKEIGNNSGRLQALSCLDLFPDERNKKQLISILMVGWYLEDSRAMAAWFTNLSPDNPIWDLAVHGAVYSALALRNDNYLRWTKQIDDQQKRKLIVEAIHREWSKVDPASAQRALVALQHGTSTTRVIKPKGQ